VDEHQREASGDIWLKKPFRTEVLAGAVSAMLYNVH